MHTKKGSKKYVTPAQKVLDYTRDWYCDCGHAFTVRVVLFTHSTSLSGETTPDCPICHKRCHRADAPKPIKIAV